jgi:hypothetical protein
VGASAKAGIRDELESVVEELAEKVVDVVSTRANDLALSVGGSRPIENSSLAHQAGIFTLAR